MQRVNKEIYKVLESALPNKTGIYPAFGSEEARFPFVVYNCDSFTTDRSKDGIEEYRMQYSVDVYSDRFDESDRIADMVIENLEGYRIEAISGVIRLTGGSSSYDGSFRHTLNFDVVVDGR